MIPTDLHGSGTSPHSAGRRQGGVDLDERCSAAVDRDGTGLVQVVSFRRLRDRPSSELKISDFV